MQHFLWSNRTRLAPHAQILLLRHLQAAAKICMFYSHSQNGLALTDIVETMDQILAAHLPPGSGDGDLVISCEGLSGHLPGWPRVESYVAAPVTAAYLTGYLAERFPQAKIQIVYSTRDPESWLHSAWRHHLLSHRMTLDWADYAARFAGSADLAGIAAQVAESLSPLPVFTLPLEEAQNHPQGPGGALLELLDLPDAVRDQLMPVGHGNRGPDPATATQLLDLNRSGMTDAAVRAEKARLVAQAGTGGWQPG
jgi:hypothetical protein